MGRRVITFDDLTGFEDASERWFSVDGMAWAIDLTDEGWEEFVDRLRPYTMAGRAAGKVTAPGELAKTTRRVAATAGPRSESAIRHDAEEVAKLRAWTEEQGVRKVQPSGRISADIWAAFRNDDLTLLDPERRPAGEPDNAPAPPRRSRRGATQPALDEPEAQAS